MRYLFLLSIALVFMMIKENSYAQSIQLKSKVKFHSSEYLIGKWTNYASEYGGNKTYARSTTIIYTKTLCNNCLEISFNSDSTGFVNPANWSNNIPFIIFKWGIKDDSLFIKNVVVDDRYDSTYLTDGIYLLSTANSSYSLELNKDIALTNRAGKRYFLTKKDK